MAGPEASHKSTNRKSRIYSGVSGDQRTSTGISREGSDLPILLYVRTMVYDVTTAVIHITPPFMRHKSIFAKDLFVTKGNGNEMTVDGLLLLSNPQ